MEKKTTKLIFKPGAPTEPEQPEDGEESPAEEGESAG